MSTLPEDHFASADRLISTARAAADEERKRFEQRIFELETELRITRELREATQQTCDAALQTTTKLLTQFGIVSQVFEDAKRLAIDAGLYTKTTTGIDQIIPILSSEESHT